MVCWIFWICLVHQLRFIRVHDHRLNQFGRFQCDFYRYFDLKCHLNVLVHFIHPTESIALQSMQLKDLLKKTEGTNFQINWLNISMGALEDRHPPNECMG